MSCVHTRPPANRLARLAAAASAALLAAVLPNSAVGQSPTFTFEEVTVGAPPLSTANLGGSYARGGFTLGCVNVNGSPCPSLTVLGAGNASYRGSQALFNNNINGVTTLARAGGGAFDLLSIRLAPFFLDGNPPASPLTVVFEGTTAPGSLVSQSFAVPLVNGFTTFSFSAAFQNLSLVRWRAGGFGPAFSGNLELADDIVVQPTAAVIPEPSTFALAGGGLLALGALARGRRRAAG